VQLCTLSTSKRKVDRINSVPFLGKGISRANHCLCKGKNNGGRNEKEIGSGVSFSKYLHE
jgi:hypothetical protein